MQLRKDIKYFLPKKQYFPGGLAWFQCNFLFQSLLNMTGIPGPPALSVTVFPLGGLQSI